MGFYLDTSALRALKIHRLSRLARSGKFYTSALALGELAAGLLKGEDEYRRRRALLVGLSAMAFPIEPDFPPRRIRRAFPILGPPSVERRLHDLCRVAQLTAGAPTLTEFAASLSVEDEQLVRSFEEEDDALSAHWTAESLTGDRLLGEMWKTFRAGEANFSTDGLPESGSLGDYVRGLGPENEEATFLGITLGLAENYHVDHEAVRENYTGTLAAYIKAMSLSEAWRAGGGSPPGRNEMVDLGHFLYLAPGDVLVANDHRMVRIARGIGWLAMRTSEPWPA